MYTRTPAYDSATRMSGVIAGGQGGGVDAAALERLGDAGTAQARVAVIAGCGSKHDKGGALDAFEPAVRFGLGGALSLAFAKAESFDHVLLLSRRQDLLDLVASEVSAACGGECGVSTLATDVTSDEDVAAAFALASSLGRVECVVFNVGAPMPRDGSGKAVGFDALPLPAAVDAAQLNAAFDVGVGGCVRLANLFVPLFEAQGRGSFLVSGATMALRGGAGFACMAPVKVALRSYAQSLSAAYHPKGVHVAHVVIDGVIDSPNTRPWSAKVTLMDPMHLAEAFVALHEQPPTCWAHEIQLGPFKGTIGQRL